MSNFDSLNKLADSELTAKAQQTLARIEALAWDSSATTEAFLDALLAYGQCLCEQFARSPHDRAFDRWVRQNGLNAGIASSALFRTNALRLAANLEGCRDALAQVKAWWETEGARQLRK